MNGKRLAFVVIAGLIAIFALVTGSDSLASEGEEGEGSELKISIEVKSTESEAEDAVWLGYLIVRANYVTEHQAEYDLRPGPLPPLFDEEVAAREAVAQIYRELKERNPELDIPYFNDLTVVDDAGFMREYVWTYLNQKAWRHEATGLRLDEFDQWCLKRIPEHRAETRGGLSVESPIESSGEDFATVVTPLELKAAEREGAQYREIYSEAVDAWKSGDPDRTRILLSQIADFRESKGSLPGVKVISVSTLSEFSAYRTMVEDEVALEWVDMVCPMSFKMLAFIDVHSQDFNKALDHLRKATDLAPLWAEPYTEIGYIYNQLQEFEKAKEAYDKALLLARTYEASSYMMPMALRGLGFTLIELGDLDAAEEAFRESLVLEPENELAQSELPYIEQTRNSNDD